MFRTSLAALLLSSSLASAQGVIPLALAQQIDANGQPLAGALLYIYVVGTVAQPQNAFQDFGLTIPTQWPIRADSTGRIPMFYLANGQVHVRLTDATGVGILDIPNLQVIGPSSGSGGGGGPGVDPTTIFNVGDIKFRPTTEVLTGWVRVNGRTIGNGMSGAAERANPDTSALFTYLWANCPQTHCAVSTGRGATAIGDFNANKTITLPDWRARAPVGLDDMGSTSSGRIAASNVTSPGDTPQTPGATGGEANHVMQTAELAAHAHPITDVAHSHGYGAAAQFQNQPGGGGITASATTAGTTSSSLTGITTTQSVGSGAAFNNMQPFTLGTWYIKL